MCTKSCQQICKQECKQKMEKIDRFKRKVSTEESAVLNSFNYGQDGENV